MAFDIALLLFGGVVLYFGAEWLVSGASALARSLQVPPLLIGLTVVAYGTSAPEVVVSTQAAAAGAAPMVIGNVVGSNVANLGLILGVTALLSPPRVPKGIARRELPVLVLMTVLLPLLLWDRVVSRFEGLSLLAFTVAYTVWMMRSSRGGDSAEALHSARVTQAAAETAGAMAPLVRRPRLVATALSGLCALVIGGKLFVSGATGLALALGISERVVGLTVVALGTSLPELATSIIAAIRGESDIAVGNVIGSNIFNVSLCLGLGSLVKPLVIEQSALSLDVGFMLGLTAVALIFLRTERTISRIEGGILLGAYTLFVALVVAA